MSSAPSSLTIHCPYLGLREDADSWATYPTSEHYCYRPATSQPIALHYQTETCLSEAYIRCPVFKAEGWRSSLPPELQPEWSSSRHSWQRWLIGVGIALLFLITGVILYNLKGGSIFAGGVSVSSTATDIPVPTLSATMTSIPERTATATPEPSITPTITATPQATSTKQSTDEPLTPTKTPDYVTEAVLAFDTNLRIGPSLDHNVIQLLDAETVLYVLGRDFDGFWLKVRINDSIKGWISAGQITSALDIPSLPVIDEYPTPATTATP